jgi:nicotinate-nucleotide adenylyltransferase
VGLLGGSFNPAHEGHAHISRLALKHLALDEIWWLVSPQNPLKPVKGMAPLPQRMAAARALVPDRRVKVTDLERRLATRYTVDTLKALRRRFPRTAFVWIAGADILEQLPRWRRWSDVMTLVPIAVFDRPSYSLRALASKAAQRFRRQRLAPRAASRLAGKQPPAWVFVPSRLHGASATALRRNRRTTSSRSKPS